MSLTVANVDEDREIQACHRQQINTGLGKLWENQPYPYEVHSVHIKVRTFVAPVASSARVNPPGGVSPSARCPTPARSWLWDAVELVPGRAVHYCRLRAVDIWLRAVDT